MRFPQKKSILHKYLLSYMLLLILPIICFSIFMGSFCGRYVINRLLHEQQLIAQSSMNDLEATLQRYRNVIADAQKNKLFFHEFSDDIPVVFIDIRRALQDMETLLSFFATAVYCDYSNKQFHTSRGLYHTYPYYEELMEKCLYIHEVRNVVSYDSVNTVIPLEYSSNRTLKTALILTIPRENMENLLFFSNTYLDTSSRLLVNGQLFYESGPEISNSSSTYHVSAISQLMDNTEIHLFIPKKQLIGNLYQLLFQALLLIALVLLFGGALIYVMIIHNYIPLQKILYRLISDFPEEKLDTLTGVQEAVAYHIQQKKQLMEDNWELQREYKLFQLLHTGYWEQTPPDDRLVLPGPEYLCVVSNTPLPPAHSLSSQSVRIEAEVSCWIYSGAESALKEFSEELLERRTAFSSSGFVGIGSVVFALSKVQESFLYGKIAYAQAERKHLPVCQYDREEQDLEYPFALMSALSDACRKADCEEYAQLSELLQVRLHDAPSNFLAICMFQDYLQTVCRALTALNPDGFDPCRFCGEYYSKPGYSRKLVADYVGSVRYDVVRYLQGETAPAKPLITIPLLKDYLAEHCLEPSFSLKTMAADFETSQSNLSHLFKRETSLTLSEYIDLFKVDWAKEALVKSSLSIREISQKLGFANASTFIRKFKKLEGITPGEYQKRCKLNP